LGIRPDLTVRQSNLCHFVAPPLVGTVRFLLLERLVVGEQSLVDDFGEVVVVAVVVAVVGNDEAPNVLDFERLRVISHAPHRELPHDGVPRFSL
jgi:hypothetical protein